MCNVRARVRSFFSLAKVKIALLYPTHNRPVDTKSLRAFGVYAATDSLSVESYYKLQNHLEDAINKYRRPAMEIARQLIH